MLDYRKMFEYMVELEGGLTRAPIAAINSKLNDSPMLVLGMECAADMIDSFVEPDAKLLH